jgi:hypothetical protein
MAMFGRHEGSMKQTRCCACGKNPPRYPNALYCQACFEAICAAEIKRIQDEESEEGDE